MSTEFNRDQLNITSMQVILHAGNAREQTMKVLTELSKEKPDLSLIKVSLKEAHAEITEAHVHQTDMIQKEANGDFIPFSVLFSHAQDTLMTIQSELLIAEKLVTIVARLEDLNNE